MTQLMTLCLLMVYLTHSISFFYIYLGLLLLNIHRTDCIICQFVITSLSSGFFAIDGGISIGRYLPLVLILSLFISNRFIKNGNELKSNILLIIFFCLFSYLLSITKHYVNYVVLLQFLVILLFPPKLAEDNKNNIYINLLLSGFIILLGIFYGIYEQGLSDIMYSSYRFTGSTDDDFEINSNNFAMMCGQIGIMMFTLFICSKEISLKIVALVLLGLDLFIIILTGSRASTLALVMACVIEYIFVNKVQIKQIFSLLLLFVFAVFLFDLIGKLGLPVLDRFSVTDLKETGGSGRLSQIKLVMSTLIWDYPLFGVGIGGDNFLAAATSYNVYKPCHNIFFDPLIQLGIVGITLFYSLIYRILKKGVNVIRNTHDHISPLLLMSLGMIITSLINGIGETIMWEKFFWAGLILCFSSANNESSTLKNNE